MRIAGLALAVVTAGVAFAARPAEAAYNLPWCAQYAVPSVRSCAFATWNQCMASISGVGGLCVQNPAAPSGPYPTEPRHHRRHRNPHY